MIAQTSSFRLPDWLRIVLIGRRPKFTLVRIVVLVAVVLATTPAVILPVRVDGGSMMPTYHAGRINFVNRLAYRRREPQRGDVVSIRYSGYHLMLMKRVVGLPGETVEFIDGSLVVNGEKVAEPYVQYPCNWNRLPQKLGPDEYFVVGDNRAMRIEDHKFGAATRERIVGKVLL
jgi:signal peptidase I